MSEKPISPLRRRMRDDMTSAGSHRTCNATTCRQLGMASASPQLSDIASESRRGRVGPWH
jgi:hypothetical protein